MSPTLRIPLLAFLLVIASTLSAQRIFRDQDPVPPDFGKAPGTLLLIRSDQKGVNKALPAVFAEYYKGPFKLIDQADLALPEYADRVTYRYAFRTVTKFIGATGSGESRMPATYNYTFNVLDLKTDVPNGLTFDGAAYKGLMKAYAKKLEEVRAGGQ